ncbi:MAG: hypothetical protein GX228_00700 [Firmicutes bacterium]|jgi:hypothetical protein|nr:hypothetical protein [Bacillota bacterium]NLL87436.1 hypothetical protein [Bacillota bacterium]
MPELNMVDFGILFLLFIVYVSFSLGYARGRKRGNHEGRVENLLALKERCLLLGQCILCGYMQDSNRVLAKNGNQVKGSE